MDNSITTLARHQLNDYKNGIPKTCFAHPKFYLDKIPLISFKMRSQSFVLMKVTRLLVIKLAVLEKELERSLE